MAIKTVGLVVNREKLPALEFAHEVIAFLTERDVEVRVDATAAPLLGRDDIACGLAGLCDSDLIITLGGDGTILSASHIAAPYQVPILGVHMGHFGFIAEAHPDDLFPNLDELVHGKMRVEERMMVRGEVIRDGKTVYSADGLNDIVLSKGAKARMLRLHTSIGEDFLATYPADGVIVATPTGSTAYALSAGGPLIEPTVQALVLVPICPHTLAARPIVIPCDESISFTVEQDGGDVLFVADSQFVFPLVTGDRVIARRADYSTRIVTFGQSGFYRKIRKRLLWGERLNT